MSNRDNIVDLEPVSDRKVSAVYREFSSETVPPHLDAAVLARARARDKSPGAAWMQRSRIAAVAASVLICVALVFEVRQGAPIADPEAINLPEAASLADATSESVASDRSVIEEAVTDAYVDSPNLAVIENRREQSAAPTAEVELRARVQPQDTQSDGVNIQSSLEAAAQKTTEALEARRDEPTLLEKEQRQSESFAAASRALVAHSPQRPDHCSESEMESPETWLKCIQQLEAHNLRSEAESEREALRAAFPDFEID